MMTRLWPQGQEIQTYGSEGLYRQKDGETMATGFEYQGHSHRIVNVCNCWRIHTRWWEPTRCVWREYLKVTTDTGLLCLIYHELTSGEWYLARIYD